MPLTEAEWISAVQQHWQGASVIEHGKVRRMVDMTEAEKIALERAVPVVGELIESFGETDLAKLSYEQFFGIIECAVTAFQDGLLRVPMQ